MKISQEQLQIAADRLWNAAQTNRPCLPVRDVIGDADIEAAYAVQRINIKRKMVEGQRVIGYKIGLTSEAVQKQLGVEQPDFGVLTDQMEVFPQTVVSVSQLMQPKAEAEIAFILSRDINRELNLDELKNFIAYVATSIEIVGSRIADWNIRISDTIADNASASHFVLAEERRKLTDLDLENCTMALWRNGVVASSGLGKACLGNPLHAALWLTNTMVKLEMELKAGHVILAGALGPMVPVVAGDHFEATIEGLGNVALSFGQ